MPDSFFATFSHPEDNLQYFGAIHCVNYPVISPQDREKMAAMPPVAPSSREKREALEEVLQSVAFFRAEQLRSFLRYICEMELAGRGGELCESLIGVEAFGRPSGYSPTEDASVRRRAGDLREKLQEVYAGELIGSRVRIELPKGKFVPRFVRVAPENGVNEELAESFPVEYSALRYGADRPAAMTRPAHLDTDLVAARLNAVLQEKTKAWRRLIIFWFAAGWLVGASMVAIAFLAYHRLHPSVSPSPASQVAATPTTAPVETSAPATQTQQAVPAPAAQTTNVEPPAAASRRVLAKGDQNYEAEATGNTMNGITEPYPCNWCSGGSRVRNIGKLPHNYLVLNNIVAPKSGQYQMLIFYVLKGERSFFISVNNGPAIEAPLSGQSWMQVSTASVTLTLNAGSNSIKLFNEHRYAPDLDRVVIRPR